MGSAISNSIMDCTDDHYDKSVFKGCTFIWKHWDKNETWKNKWENGDPAQGEKFFGSSRWFVGLTDPWHFFKGMCFWFLAFSIAPAMIASILLFDDLHQWWWFLVTPFIVKIVYSSTFHIFFTWIFIRKSKK